MASTWTTIDVDDSPMESYLALPSGDGPFPGVVVAMHAYGVDAGARKFCDDLALEGFACHSPLLLPSQQGHERSRVQLHPLR